MNNPIQRYISSELTHFVGRGLEREQQYKTLLKIISEGVISHPPHSKRGQGSGSITFNRTASFSSNQMYNPQVVCFCDIPLSDLSIHISKYSYFGIAFNKDFPIAQGASPVFYIPLSSRVLTVCIPSHTDLEEMRISGAQHTEYVQTSKGQHFDMMVHKYLTLITSFSRFIDPSAKPLHPTHSSCAEESFWSIQMDVRFFMDFHIFSFIKFFDPSLPDNHPDNFYFEREWRICGNLIFEKKDISRIIVPHEYAERFNKDCRDYYGQITFSDR